MRRSLLLFWCALSCSSNGPERVSFPLELSGEKGASSVVTTPGPVIHLDLAQLAFGPLYFCASPTGAEHCDVARLEWLGTAVVDLLDESPERVGTVAGSTGHIASFLCDLSISSQLTQDEPFVLDAAAELDGSSLRLRGSVDYDGRTLPFSADLPVQQSETTVQGVPVIQSSPSQGFEAEVSSDMTGLTMSFSVAHWLAAVDLTPYFVESDCSTATSGAVCQDGSSLTCTGAGEIDSVEDCAKNGQICLPGLGCRDQLVLTEDDAALRTLKATLVSSFNPKFTWHRD